MVSADNTVRAKERHQPQRGTVDEGLLLHEWLGREVEVVVDRPLGSVHPHQPDIRYAVNYGYVTGTLAPDGREVDIYVLGASEPLERCRATVIAIIRRRDDIEDKLVGSVGGAWSRDAISAATAFQEQYFDSWIEMPE